MTCLIGILEMFLIITVVVHAMTRSSAGTPHNHLTLREPNVESRRLVADLDVNLVAELLERLKAVSNYTMTAKSTADEVEKGDLFCGVTKFQVGDIVEQIYNVHSMKSRVLYPYRIEEKHFMQNPDDQDEVCGGIRYSLVRLIDGFRIENTPESSLRNYLPYTQDAKALCNVGGYGLAQKLLPCAVEEVYISGHAQSTSRAEYIVTVQGEGGKEEEMNLPIESLQRLSDAYEARWEAEKSFRELN